MAKWKDLDCGTTVKVSKGNATNLMSHLRTKDPKMVRQKADKKVFVSKPRRSLSTPSNISTSEPKG